MKANIAHIYVFSPCPAFRKAILELAEVKREVGREPVGVSGK